MPFVLFRIDDRLIHGQVTVAWGAWLSPDRIVLVNDDVAQTEWKRDMYSTTDSMGVAISIVSVDEFTAAALEERWVEERVLVVVESPSDLLRLVRAGVAVGEANIGGLHYADGKREILPYVCVDDADIEAMRELTALGTTLEARDVPQTASIDIWKLLDGDCREGGGEPTS